MNDNPFFDQPEGKKRNWFTFTLQSVVILISICIILYLFVITPNQITGPSMEPNFYSSQLVLTNRITQWIGSTPFGKSINLDYKVGDVVVFQKPGNNEFVKRIVALPGDRVAIREGYVYVNNLKMLEEYLPPALYTRGGDFVINNGESVVVPEGHYFCLGDNRPVSNDSRYESIGFVNREWVKGKVIIKFWPLDSFGLVSTGEYQLI
jgi:signal peptidase I